VGGPYNSYGKRTGVYSDLVGKPEGNRPLGRPRHRWEDIKIYLQEVGYGLWTGSSWLRIGTGDTRVLALLGLP
jgi:hypothetical protein